MAFPVSFFKTTALAAAVSLGVLTAAEPAFAFRGGGFGGGGFHGGMGGFHGGMGGFHGGMGGWHGGGWHGGGWGGGWHGAGWRGGGWGWRRGWGGWGWGAPVAVGIGLGATYPYWGGYYDYPYGYDCTPVTRRVWTAYGWRWRTVCY